MTTDPTPGMSHHHFDEQDLTAFALGELDPASATHNAIAAALASDPAIRAEIDAIKQSASTVTDALAHEPVAAADGTGGTGILHVGAPQDKRHARPTRAQHSEGHTPLFARPALLAAGFALAAGAAVAVVSLMQNNPVQPIVHTAATPQGLDAIHAALDTPVTASFKDAPLQAVFDAVAETTHTELAIDWDALEARGIARDATLTFDAEAIPARDLLTMTLSAAWQQLPHPDPVVWTVTPTGVHVEPRSATVQRSLDQAQRVLASLNTTHTRMSDRQLALADDPSWQQPGAVTDVMVAQRQAEVQARVEYLRSRVADADTLAEQGKLVAAVALYTDLEPYIAVLPGLPEKLAEARSQLAEARRYPEPLANPSPDPAIVHDETLEHFNRFFDLSQEAAALYLHDAALDDLVRARTVLNANRQAFSELELQAIDQSLSAHTVRIAEIQAMDAERAEHNQFQADGSIHLARLEADPDLDFRLRSTNGRSESEFDHITDTLATLSERVPPTGTRNLQYPAQQQAQTRGRARGVQAGRGIYQDGDTTRGLDGLAGGSWRFESASAAPSRNNAGYDIALGQSFYADPAGLKGQTIVAGVVVDRSRHLAAQEGLVLREQLRQIQDPLATADILVLGEMTEEAREHLNEPRDEPYRSRDTYALVNDNPFHTGLNDPLSTFSVDVDTAAYSIVRRQLMQQHVAPVPEAVRIEELINYFDYGYDAPKVEPELLENGVVTQASLERLAADDDTFAPFATHVEVTDCPWAEGHQLVRIGIKGMEVEQEDRPAAHLTFLLDVSGSMNNANKLPLVKESLTMLLGQLNEDDHVSIVVYAGAAGLVLEHASAADIPAIEEALGKLSAGGSTAGGAGIELAYNVAQRHYIDGGVNRVILCTDGDFNVGISDRDALVDLIKDKANPEPGEDGQTRGVYLSAMGFGFGNLNDNMMEPLTNAGNGNYAYIDTADEAHKVMVEQVGGTLVTIAKDVKIQVEFNPGQVLAYRLIGYENRILAAEDFANDTVDAGDIGAGHTVTALYEVVPFPDDGLGDEESLRMVKEQIEVLDEALAFSVSVLENTPLTEEQYQKLVGSVRMMQQQREVAAAMEARAKGRVPAALFDGIEMRYRDGDGFIDGLDEVDELLVVNLRYKPVDAPAEQGTSRLIQTTVGAGTLPFNDASEDTRFAAAVAGFGMVLRHSPHRGEADMQWVLDTANAAAGNDAFGYRAGFITLVERAAELVPEDAAKDRNVLVPGGNDNVLEPRE